MDIKYPRLAVCLLVESTNSEGMRVILLQKRLKKRNYFGFWELPQGAIQQGESILDAASRELKEETGLSLLEVKQNHNYHIDFLVKSNVESLIPIICVVDIEHGLVGIALNVIASGSLCDTAEAADHRWVNEREAIELIQQNLVFPINAVMIKKVFSGEKLAI